MILLLMNMPHRELSGQGQSASPKSFGILILEMLHFGRVAPDLIFFKSVAAGRSNLVETT